MFRIFAASVRRIALGFYETGLLTLPHFFFLRIFDALRLLPGKVYDREKV